MSLSGPVSPALFLAVALALNHGLFAGPARADSVSVTAPDWEDRRTVEIGKGELAVVTVFLQSMGRLLDGFEVTLRAVPPNGLKPQTVVTGPDGIAKFEKVPAGLYEASVKQQLPERGSVSTVSVGDISVGKSTR